MLVFSGIEENMSFEGYYQSLCKNGHLLAFDCFDYDFQEGNSKCHCGESIVYSNLVDQTNDEGHPEKFEIAFPAKHETCNLGHIHVTVPARYKIPNK